ncbi:hypothetical protein ACFU5O_31410 [Streptomyces sp. NPDC057445]
MAVLAGGVLAAVLLRRAERGERAEPSEPSERVERVEPRQQESSPQQAV